MSTKARTSLCMRLRHTFSSSPSSALPALLYLWQLSLKSCNSTLRKISQLPFDDRFLQSTLLVNSSTGDTRFENPLRVLSGTFLYGVHKWLAIVITFTITTIIRPVGGHVSCEALPPPPRPRPPAPQQTAGCRRHMPTDATAVQLIIILL